MPARAQVVTELSDLNSADPDATGGDTQHQGAAPHGVSASVQHQPLVRRGCELEHDDTGRQNRAHDSKSPMARGSARGNQIDLSRQKRDPAGGHRRMNSNERRECWPTKGGCTRPGSAALITLLVVIGFGFSTYVRTRVANSIGSWRCSLRMPKSSITRREGCRTPVQ